MSSKALYLGENKQVWGRRVLTVGSTRTPTLAMASPFFWPVLVPSALRAPAPVNLGVRRETYADKKTSNANAEVVSRDRY